jgi:Cys-tRNA(Pro) deacylase
MAKDSIPVTAAIRALRAAGAPFEARPYRYEPKGGTRASSQALGVDEHSVIKTLIMQDEAASPLVILMHGDREVSTKALARHIGVKSIDPCAPAVAERHTGYQVGGTSPFGLRKPLPIYAEASIRDLPILYINGGKRGLLVELTPQALEAVLSPVWVEAATSAGG